MADFLVSNSMLMLEKAMNFQWTKQSTILNNVVNADTPGYKTKYVTFEEALRSSLRSARMGSQPLSSMRSAISSASPAVHTADDETFRMDGNGVNVTEQLTEAVRRHPYSVILFDEVEKAHPDVFNVLLQVLDDGRITDSQGRTVDFKNTVIILTSNLGSQFLLDGIGEDGEIDAQARSQVDELLKRSFRPEFLNRLDEIVFYKPLTKNNITHIIDLLMEGLNRRLSDKQLTVTLTPAAKDEIIEAAYDPIYGARPLKRFIQSKVETMVAREMIAADPAPGTKLVVDCQDGRLTLSKTN